MFQRNREDRVDVGVLGLLMANRRNIMTGRFAWLSALALSAGVCSVSFADVTGKAVFDGTPPKPKVISMKAIVMSQNARV